MDSIFNAQENSNCTAAIRDQAIVFHAYLSEKYGKTENFNASKGRFERFKTRFLLHNIKYTGKCYMSLLLKFNLKIKRGVKLNLQLLKKVGKNFYQKLKKILMGEVDGEGFEDIEDAKVLELVVLEKTDLTPEELEELIDYPPEEKPEFSEVSVFNPKTISEIISLIERVAEQAVSNDPIVVRSLNFKRHCHLAIQIYEELYRDILVRTK